ncbi:MAG: tyrosine-type recombinase/integrase [Vicinamibacterales bacterium]
MTEKRRRPRAKGTGGIFKHKGSRNYWIAYMSGGKRHFESSGSDRKKDAQALLTSRIGDTQRGLVVTPRLGRITLGEGLKAVINDLTMNGKKAIADVQRRIDLHILKVFSPDRRMGTISTADIEGYKAHRLGQKAKPATVNRELAVVRRAFRLALRGGELAAIPHVGLLQEHNVRQGFFERDQFDAILKHLPTEYHAPLRFAYITGWRFKSEVLSLTAAQVDLKAGFVRLEVGTTKSGEGRSFYVTEDLRTLLKAQLASIEALAKRDIVCPYLFHRDDGTQIRDFKKAWRSACEAAGYPGKLFHDFRRTAVRNLERAAVPRSTAMAMVGHKTEAIYRRYAIVDEAMHREAAAKLDVWAATERSAAQKGSRGQVRRFRRG